MKGERQESICNSQKSQNLANIVRMQKHDIFSILGVVVCECLNGGLGQVVLSLDVLDE